MPENGPPCQSWKYPSKMEGTWITSVSWILNSPRSYRYQLDLNIQRQIEMAFSEWPPPETLFWHSCWHAIWTCNVGIATLFMVYTTHKNGDWGDGLLLLYPHHHMCFCSSIFSGFFLEFILTSSLASGWLADWLRSGMELVMNQWSYPWTNAVQRYLSGDTVTTIHTTLSHQKVPLVPILHRPSGNFKQLALENGHNVGIAIINHPPFITIFMGGINQPSIWWVVNLMGGLWHCYTHITINIHKP